MPRGVDEYRFDDAPITVESGPITIKTKRITLPDDLGSERRMVWPTGLTAADLRAAFIVLDSAVNVCRNEGDRRSLMRVRDAIRSEHSARSRLAIVTPTGRKYKRRAVK